MHIFTRSYGNRIKMLNFNHYEIHTLTSELYRRHSGDTRTSNINISFGIISGKLSFITNRSISRFLPSQPVFAFTHCCTLSREAANTNWFSDGKLYTVSSKNSHFQLLQKHYMLSHQTYHKCSWGTMKIINYEAW
jgi:hypothetical protein